VAVATSLTERSRPGFRHFPVMIDEIQTVSRDLRASDVEKTSSSSVDWRGFS